MRQTIGLLGFLVTAWVIWLRTGVNPLRDE